jgi:predicted flavoprotein YhiN
MFSRRGSGHTLVQTTPALTPLLANCPPHAALSGNTLPVRLTLKDGDKTLVQFSGSFLFTHVGYSGPVALNMSRTFARERWQHPMPKFGCACCPTLKTERSAAFGTSFAAGTQSKLLSTR